MPEERSAGFPGMPGAGEPGRGGGLPASGPSVRDPWLDRLLVPAFESQKWLKFLGVVMIAGGVLTAISLFGLVVAWVYIWLGALLWQAGNRAESAYLRRDPAMLEQFMIKVKNLAMIGGVLTIVSIALAVIAGASALIFGWMAWLARGFR